MYDEIQRTQKLVKQQLGSINALDIIKLQDEEEKLSDQEVKSRAEMARNFYKNNFDKTLRLMIIEQLKTMGKESETQGKVLINQGIITGIGIVEAWFKIQSGIAHPEEDEEESDETIPRVG